HAPWALEVNGINLVIAESFARIFRQNMFNNGMMAVELPAETIEEVFNTFKGRETNLETDFNNGIFIIYSSDISLRIPFTLAEFDRELVKAGGWVDYAEKHY
ncbi:MAG: 3-isopropylmalate dehydratase small subunit, partial [Spirochaetes bacterium]